jgi:hypothetical protein
MASKMDINGTFQTDLSERFSEKKKETKKSPEVFQASGLLVLSKQVQ